jgi:hypothetical protein
MSHPKIPTLECDLENTKHKDKDFNYKMFQLYYLANILDSNKMWVSKIFWFVAFMPLHSVCASKINFVCFQDTSWVDANFIFPKIKPISKSSNQIFCPQTKSLA